MSPEKIAVVGGGISGLSLALALAHATNGFSVTLFEKKKRLGGHSRTLKLKDSQTKKTVAVDTGFIVYNEVNYPELTKLFSYLGIATQEAKMNFWYHLAEKKYNFNSYKKFRDPWNFINLSHYKLLLEIFFFQARARKNYQGIDSNASLAQWLDELRASPMLRKRFIYPLGAAIWSMPIDKIEQYPARYFAQFFFNHGLFKISATVTWRTVVGGAIVYVEKIKKKLLSFGGKIIDGDGVVMVEKKPDGKLLVKTTSGKAELFDRVVFACHSDQALAMLGAIDHPAKESLAMIDYKASDVFTHRQTDFLPSKKNFYACWNFFETAGKTTMIYWMNALQSLKTRDNFFVTLNPLSPLATYDDRTIMEHPQYNLSTAAAQQGIKSAQGVDNIYFCGAYLGYGFHEDGIKSAVALLPYFKASTPW
ncbi:MAG: FAD-dependent oxidoreductase [Hydrotalea sp.]|nr:FAD-dependent oxidoreductase [Hydrotalea sp.]